jgi:prepilin-type N-terminal cleavage/methylation domain-containing protein
MPQLLRSRRCPRRARSAFTLVEILIATVILSIGLVGVLSLVVAALKTSGQVVESGFASTIARSVYEALRAGARQYSFVLQDNASPPNTFRGFLLICDGVNDGGSTTPPALPNPLDTATTLSTKLTTLQGSDFAIFLPPPPATTGATNEIYYVFPRPEGSAGATVSPTGTATENQSFADDSYPTPRAGYGGAAEVVYDVRRVYNFNSQYGYAVSIHRAAAPTLASSGVGIAWADSSGNLDSTGAIYPPGGTSSPVNPQNGLYQVEVMVFRNFQPFAWTSHTDTSAAVVGNQQAMWYRPVPGGTFVGLIAVGG